MKNLVWLGAFLLTAGLASPTASARALKSGVWKYRTSNHWMKGRCPAPVPGKGKVKIQRTGKRIKVTVLSGMKCKPKSMCFFKGQKQGKRWVAKNSARVDNEGGVAKNWLRFVVSAKKRLTGKVNSEYKHPSGFTCKWGFNFVAWR